MFGYLIVIKNCKVEMNENESMKTVYLRLWFEREFLFEHLIYFVRLEKHVAQDSFIFCGKNKEKVLLWATFFQK